MIKHATASVFMFTRAGNARWEIGLIKHPRLGRWMLPGGHVEPHENAAEAAIREAEEEAGHLPQLLTTPVVELPPTGTGPHVHVPLWIVEQQVPADSRHPHPHIHVDHLYLAIVETVEPGPAAELSFRWFSDDELDRLDTFPESRTLARWLFARIDSYYGSRSS